MKFWNWCKNNSRLIIYGILSIILIVLGVVAGRKIYKYKLKKTKLELDRVKVQKDIAYLEATADSNTAEVQKLNIQIHDRKEKIKEIDKQIKYVDKAISKMSRKEKLDEFENSGY